MQIKLPINKVIAAYAKLLENHIIPENSRNIMKKLRVLEVYQNDSMGVYLDQEELERIEYYF